MLSDWVAKVGQFWCAFHRTRDDIRAHISSRPLDAVSICYEVSCNSSYLILDFLNLQGTLENKARFFAHKGKYDSVWAFNSILEFLQTQKERLIANESAGTIRN